MVGVTAFNANSRGRGGVAWAREGVAGQKWFLLSPWDYIRVSDPGPDPTFEKKPDPGPTLENKPDPDPTFEKNPNPDPTFVIE